ncbi:trypsin-like serine peptidase [Roseibium sediminicola]|uniref:Trypsin-like serine protease n=1 Tax=Roseibium sediminicola TaxID=2933272 RepID=A0ABT0H0B2_9HYPH|nr:serine protease [Roseibium sp. CAU 1639]MCK7614530.1 trypsin-like serine protease [Roseibium sp. CAU 1639]
MRASPDQHHTTTASRRHRWAGRLFSLALTTLAFTPVQAVELKVIDSKDAPWPSIGRVNVAGYRSTSMCTGTLIAPNLVLTAAHCLFNKKTLKPFPADDLLFIAGVRREEYSARLEPACFFANKDYLPRQKPKLRDVHDDVGLIVLKEPSTLPPVPALTLEEAAVLTKDTRFQSVGYRRSRRFLPTVVEACKVMGTTEDAWVTDCASEAGASGGPLLVETPDGLRVAGVMSAKIDDVRSAIVPFFEWQELLGNPSCQTSLDASTPALRSTLPPAE